MSAQPFIKMHGLGNDFVVLDARARQLRLGVAEARAIADRRTGVGCDQVILIEPSRRADAFMRIHNADGGEVAACGNGARCVGALLMDESGAEQALIETEAGLQIARRAGHGLVSVDMGAPALGWQEIPLARAMDTLHLELEIGPASAPVLADPVAVNMGNPHAIFFVDEVADIDLAIVGPMIERHPLFPERANVSVAALNAPEVIRLRVWERGVGVTSACGTAACATLVAAHRRGLVARAAQVVLDGGPLEVAWGEDDHVIMTGPVATSFAGTLEPGLLAAEAAE
jgi:diaminopimelate epimerase